MTRSLIVAAIILASACAHPLSSLRSEMEQGNAFKASYARPTFSTPACDRGVAQLEAVAKAQKITVVYEAPPGVIGMADRQHGVIYIESNVIACGRLEVLAHELAHLMQPPSLWGHLPDAQVFADGVSYLVVRRLAGYDPRDRYAAYLASFKTSGPVLDLYRHEIDVVVRRLVGEQ